MKKNFITTPIYYINDKPHIGHAYTTLAADILSRHYRNKNIDTFFLTGTDEHGAKILRAAKIQGIEPQKFADEISQQYIDLWKKLNIKYDKFVRTTDAAHIKVVGEFIQKIYDRGEIYKGEYRGLYCVGCEEYYIEKDLIDKKCPIHKTACEEIVEEIYYFRLSKYQDQLIDIIEKNEIIIEPETRRNEVLSFLKKEPLKDLAITRSKVKWGVKVPWDDTQTVYVWFDALLNYLSAADGNFPPDIQLMAKDIFRFHAIIWPAMLLAAGEKYPKKLFIHGYFTIDNEKMSKTRGNIIDPIDIVNKYGVDALRYFLFREVPFGLDGDFSIKRLDERYRSDLSNDLGNLVQRVLVMREKYEIDWQYQKLNATHPDIEKDIEDLKFSDALEKIWAKITEANQKIDAEKPWEIAKTDKEKLSKIIIELLETISDIANLISPFMPKTSEKIINQLQTKKPEVLFPKI